MSEQLDAQLEAMTGDNPAVEPAEEVQSEGVVEGDAQGAAVQEPEGDDNPPQGYVPQKALHEERANRQRLQEELAYWKGKAEAHPQPQQTDPEPEEEFDNYEFFTNGAKYVEDRAKQLAEEQIKSFRQELLQREVIKSANRARKKHKDFEEAEAEFVKMASDNPALVQRMYAEDDPAEWAYEYVKAQKRAEKFKDFDEESMRAKIREELLAEMNQGGGAANNAVNLPKTQAGARGASGSTPQPIPDDPMALLRGAGIA